MKFWIGVASYDHVRIGEQGDFCQLCHGKNAPLNRMQPGDWLMYYSPKQTLAGREKCQEFTAIGEVISQTAYQFMMTPDFIPYRKDIAFIKEHRNVPLSFVRDHPLWHDVRTKLRYGHFEVPEALFRYIAKEMLRKKC